MIAPIVLFVYNRPSHTARTLEALSRNALATDSSLFIFCDGARPNASSNDLANIASVRKIVKDQRWCKALTIVERVENMGLADSVKQGVSEILTNHESVIVLEDDLETSSSFLQYMNRSLEVFGARDDVWSIAGHMFPVRAMTSKTVLLPYISTWGWATWRDKWSTFANAPAQNIDAVINSPELTRLFNLGDYDYASILKNHYGTSWGIQWYFHVFARHGLSVYPTKSLVRNIGKDGSGTHYKTAVDVPLEELVSEIEVVDTTAIDLEFWRTYLEYFRQPYSLREKLVRNVLGRKS